MSSEQLTERLIGCIDCKQGAVRAARFNGRCAQICTVYKSVCTVCTRVLFVLGVLCIAYNKKSKSRNICPS